jgi:hypothetical protein
MAWRVDEFLVRGEIDNRARGRVTGRLWFADCADPIELDLGGDAWRDLAGRRLVFTNPQPKPGLPAGLRVRQTGVVGDITASRKVKVPEIPLEQIGEYYEARKPWPWHWGNALYLEWFGAANGRVVIESTDYKLTISGDPTWDMTPAEEEEQRHANGEAIVQFMDRLGDAVSAASGTPSEAGEEDRPLTEEGAERMLEESDRLVDRIQARMGLKRLVAGVADPRSMVLADASASSFLRPSSECASAGDIAIGRLVCARDRQKLIIPDRIDDTVEYRTKHAVGRKLLLFERQAFKDRNGQHPVVFDPVKCLYDQLRCGEYPVILAARISS